MIHSEYENKAVELATNIDRVWEMRKKIEASRETSVLFDTKQAVKDLEKGYHAIFKRHEMGLERDHISIE
jgi:protein O-GlcNAc transferase